MELVSALKQTEGRFALIGDRLTNMNAKLEDLMFRAHKIANGKKNNMPNHDTMFGYDLQNLRREIRNFSHEVGALPQLLGSIERISEFDENALRYAQNLMRLSDRLNKSLAGLYDKACLAHNHIRESDLRVEAWYLCQEIEQMAEKGKALPTVANKIVVRCGTNTAAAPAPPEAGPPSSAPTSS